MTMSSETGICTLHLEITILNWGYPCNLGHLIATGLGCFVSLFAQGSGAEVSELWPTGQLSFLVD